MPKEILTLIAISFIGINVANASQLSRSEYDDVVAYIKTQWGELTRSMSECSTFGDTKLRSFISVYLPVNLPMPTELNALRKKCQINITYLPYQDIKELNTQPLSASQEGLLYLPHPYIVPGGIFNEMYGWDSYFIIRGLIESGLTDLAKGMVENFFFEIKYYGKTLNANRSYYLSRSQPPFLSSMVREVYSAMKRNGDRDLVWLAQAYQYVLKDYLFWTTGQHLAGETGLSRYYDFQGQPINELREINYTYYRDALKYFLLHPREFSAFVAKEGSAKLVGHLLTVKICKLIQHQIKCQTHHEYGLTNDFYRNDRSLRESGLDMTFRFGPFGANTIQFIPIELNSLLYKVENDLAWMNTELNKHSDAAKWLQAALHRKKIINEFLWDDKQEMFVDYNFVTKKRSEYQYITSFFPLWVGLASPQQAQSVKNHLKLFEYKGGLTSSMYNTGGQWDYPYGWPPFQLITIEGLRRYGYHADADRLTKSFLDTVATNFRKEGTIREKYNVVSGSSHVAIKLGYRSNEIGFGWTNAVFLVLLHELSNNHPSLSDSARRCEPVQQAKHIWMNGIPSDSGGGLDKLHYKQ